MKIDREFTLPARFGFERSICSDGSMFFQRWEKPAAVEDTSKDERKVEVQESCMYYGGRNMISYIVSIPRPLDPLPPPKPRCIGSVLLVRSSQNRYRIAAQRGSERVEFNAVSTLKEVVEFVESFFA